METKPPPSNWAAGQIRSSYLNLQLSANWPFGSTAAFLPAEGPPLDGIGVRMAPSPVSRPLEGPGRHPQFHRPWTDESKGSFQLSERSEFQDVGISDHLFHIKKLFPD